MNEIMYEQLFVNGQHCNVPVIDTITLTEEQPSEGLLQQFTQKKISGEKGILIKKIAGFIFFMAAIASIIFMFYFKIDDDTFGDIELFKGWGFNPMIIVMFGAFMGFVGLGLAMFQRKKATSPTKCFKKYWGKIYFKAPDYIFTGNVKCVYNIGELFFSPAEIIGKLKSLYPLPIEVNEKDIARFIARLSEVVKARYACFQPNKSSELLYGVNYWRNPNYKTLKINETVLAIESNMNIFRFCTGISPKDECIKLNIRMYFVKMGQYWAPVNHIPQFKELIEM